MRRRRVGKRRRGRGGRARARVERVRVRVGVRVLIDSTREDGRPVEKPEVPISSTSGLGLG